MYRQPGKDIREKKGNERKLELWGVETLDDLQKYLSSSIFHQVGPMTAKKIVSAFGARTIKVIEKSSHELGKLNGVGRHRISSIISGWTIQRRLRKACIILLKEQQERGGKNETRDHK